MARAEAVPSDATTAMDASPAKSGAGTNTSVGAVPETVPSATSPTVHVNASPSTSDPTSDSRTARSSAVETWAVGASFTGATCRVTTASSLAPPPSVTRTTSRSVPCQSAVGR